MRERKRTPPSSKRLPHRKLISACQFESAAKPVAPEELSAGQRVYGEGIQAAVIFRRHDGRMAEVEAGPMRMKVPLADIVAIRARCSGPQAGRNGRRLAPMESPSTRSLAMSPPPKKSM